MSDAFDLAAMVAAIRSDDRTEQGRGAAMLADFLARNVRSYGNRLTDADADDIVQNATMRLWAALRRNGTPIEHAGYLRLTLRNEVATFFRRNKRNRAALLADPDSLEKVAGAAIPGAIGAGDPEAELRAPFDRLVEAAVAGLRPEVGADLRATCDGLWRQMNESSPTPFQVAPGETLAVAKNRYQQRQSRARKTLLATLDRLVASGEITREDELLQRELLSRLRRRQQRRAPRV